MFPGKSNLSSSVLGLGVVVGRSGGDGLGLGGVRSEGLVCSCDSHSCQCSHSHHIQPQPQQDQVTVSRLISRPDRNIFNGLHSNILKFAHLLNFEVKTKIRKLHQYQIEMFPSGCHERSTAGVLRRSVCSDSQPHSHHRCHLHPPLRHYLLQEEGLSSQQVPRGQLLQPGLSQQSPPDLLHLHHPHELHQQQVKSQEES